MTRTLLIMAGGTGGHIMPGLAIAETMRARGWAIRWLGTAHGMENRLVPEAGIALDTIAFAGLRGKGLGHTLRGIGQLISGLVESIRFVSKLKPHAVLGMGGYVTVPGGFAAALARIPLALMNSDSSLLMSNRALKPFATRLMFGLPGKVEEAGDKAIWTGSPVRASIGAMPPPAERFATRSGPLRVLVLGGSLGAATLNRNVPLALASIDEAERPDVIHQAGAQHAAALAAVYRDVNVTASVVPFIGDMAACYAEADLVICRAGAITVSELTAAGVASILVPLVASTTTHQRDNAIYLAAAGAAIHLPQDELSAQSLSTLLRSMTRQRLLSMAEAARSLGKPRATDAVADEIEALARKETA
jgi:UDP-N-acetylglucosamine--N-acetylmuramyl-(pentapeptide) pyrophosphoryl-undecaprenol N-acetylglucosamine transferase